MQIVKRKHLSRKYRCVLAIFSETLLHWSLKWVEHMSLDDGKMRIKFVAMHIQISFN